MAMTLANSGALTGRAPATEPIADENRAELERALAESQKQIDADNARKIQVERVRVAAEYAAAVPPDIRKGRANLLAEIVRCDAAATAARKALEMHDNEYRNELWRLQPLREELRRRLLETSLRELDEKPQELKERMIDARRQDYTRTSDLIGRQCKIVSNRESIDRFVLAIPPAINALEALKLTALCGAELKRAIAGIEKELPKLDIVPKTWTVQR